MGAVGYRFARGRRAEALVCDHLREAGYAILGVNMRFGALEIDIVARRGNTVCVCEVRTRSAAAFCSALASLDHTKRSRILAAAHRAWHDFVRDLEGAPRLRIDVAEVHFSTNDTWRIRYHEGAITDEPAT